MRVTLLEDDPAQAAMLIGWLRDAGHEVSHFDSGAAMQSALQEGRFDLLILDWELPDTTGIDVLKQVRSEVNWHVPVLFVTARDSESDIVEALSSGADDYMVKQISAPEFTARISALSRRLGAEELDYEVGPYRFVPQAKTAFVNGEQAELTAKDFDLAWYLFRNLGALLSREQLLRDVWKVSGLNTRTVDVHVSRIRKSLQIHPELGYRIKTIYQHGYRLEELSKSV